MRSSRPYVSIKDRPGYKPPVASLVKRKKFLTRKDAQQPKTERQIRLSKAKDASHNQIEYLKSLLGGCSTSTAMEYTAFANGYNGEPCSLDRWDILKGKRWLSRIYWIRAIDMALTGSNDIAKAADLIEQGDDFDGQFEDGY